MATPIGTDTLNSVTRRYIIREIPEAVYPRNALTFRLIRSNKMMVQGGSQIEQPIQYKDLDYGGPFTGAAVLPMGPSEVLKSAAWDWKEYYVPLVFDGRTLRKNDSPESIASLIKLYTDIAYSSMANHIGTGVWSDGSDIEKIDGLEAAVDDGTVAATYGGLTRASNTFMNANRDGTTGTLTLAALQSLFGNCLVGAHSPTSIWSRQEQYNRYYGLLLADTQLNVNTAGAQEDIYGQAGFSNLLFNGVPWIVDDKVPDGPNSSNSGIYMLNEDNIHLVIHNKGDFEMTPWVMPDNQNVVSCRLHWMGNLIVDYPGTQGVMTNISA